MLDLHVDLGQIIISTLILAIGWLIKSEISTFKTRLDKHDSMLIHLVSDVQRLIGITMSESPRPWSGYDRRRE